MSKPVTVFPAFSARGKRRSSITSCTTRKPAGRGHRQRSERWLEEGDETRVELERQWREPFGDRRQEIVLIGQHLHPANLISMLDGALLTNFEMGLGPAAWKHFKDPFAKWQIVEESSETAHTSGRHAHEEPSPDLQRN